MPKGGGFVRLAPTDFAEMTGIPWSDRGTQEFCISAFHQIHCLVTLKNIFDSFRSGEDGVAHHGGDPVYHADHCFDYLRQVRPSSCALKYSD